MVKRRSETKTGIILSYILLFVNTLYGLLITPYILRYVWESSYGVYKSISSLSASLAVMDLGLGATMTRYMAKYNAVDAREKANNFSAMMFIQFAIIAVVIALVGVIIHSSIPLMYRETFSGSEIDLAQALILILVLNLILRLFENLLSGIATGYERFSFANGIKLFNVVAKFSLILVLLPIVKNVLLIVVLESVLVISCIIVLLWFVIRKIGIVPKLKKWDKNVFSESLIYTILMFVQSITTQFNGNIDNVLIGSFLGSSSVTVYSMALVIFGMYEQLSGSVATIMLPNMTKRIVAGQTAEQLQEGVEKAGRFQFFLLGAALGGFLVLGQDFFYLWLGEGYGDCYWLTLILIIPITIPMIQNVALSILRAQNKMVYRTVTLALSCVVNVIITVMGIKLWGYWGAAIGTAAATIANVIFMNVYYHKHLRFNVFQMFKNILAKTFECVLITTVCIGFFRSMLKTSWFAFILCAILYLIIYGLLLLSWGMNPNEKGIIIKRFGRKL